MRPRDLQYVVGPTDRPLPSKYWITANHTDGNKNPLGLIAVDGKVLRAPTPGAIFAVTKNNEAVIRDAWGLAELAGFRFALSATARVLRAGSLYPDQVGDKVLRRSGIGIRPDGSIVHLVLDKATHRGLGLVLASLGCTEGVQLSFSTPTLVEENKLIKGSYPVVALLGANWADKLITPVVVIDPGHGGADPGAGSVYLPKREAYYNLQYALLAVRVLQDYHCTVLLTRTEDVGVSLADRAALANAAGADYFVSCHNNAGGGRGFESFVNEPPAEGDVAAQEIIHRNIRDAVLNRFDERDRGMKREAFYVLRKTDMRAILLEGAFMDHPEDAQFLANREYIDALGGATAMGIVQVLKLERKTKKEPEPTTQYAVEIPAKSLIDAQDIMDKLLTQSYNARIVEK